MRGLCAVCLRIGRLLSCTIEPGEWLVCWQCGWFVGSVAGAGSSVRGAVLLACGRSCTPVVLTMTKAARPLTLNPKLNLDLSPTFPAASSQDLLELRDRKWEARRKAEGPKRIEDIHRDAERAAAAAAARDRNERRGGGRMPDMPPPREMRRPMRWAAGLRVALLHCTRVVCPLETGSSAAVVQRTCALHQPALAATSRCT